MGCAAAGHEDLSPWLDRVRLASHDFRDCEAIAASRRWAPRESRVPATALQWEPRETALFLLTAGTYNPSVMHASCQPVAHEQGHSILISVVAPTTERRHHFHPLLYECFRRQVYEP